MLVGALGLRRCPHMLLHDDNLLFKTKDFLLVLLLYLLKQTLLVFSFLRKTALHCRDQTLMLLGSLSVHLVL